ncbi:hypothetical protein D3C78_1471790 [compost metagenome]
MFAQNVAGGAGDIGDNRRLAAGQCVQQAGFAGVWPPGDHHLHPFTQQAALARFGAYAVQIGHNAVELRFDFTVRQEVDFLIGEVDGRFHIDPQVSKCFHKLVDAGGKSPLQRVHG